MSIYTDSEKTPRKSRWFWGNIEKQNLDHLRQTEDDVNYAEIKHALNYKYLLVFFLCLCIIFSSIGISGCTPNKGSSVSNYLLEIRYAPFEMTVPDAPGIVNPDAYTTWNLNIANKSDVAVRIGYFGTCTKSRAQSEASRIIVTGNNTISQGYPEWFCSTNVTELAIVLAAPTDDMFNIVYLANSLRTGHMSPAVLIISIILNFMALCMLLVATLKHGKFFYFSATVTFAAWVMGLLGMVWQQTAVDVAARVVENLSNRSIKCKAGSVPAGLGWTSILILFVTLIGLVSLIMIIHPALRIFARHQKRVEEQVAERENEDIIPNSLNNTPYPVGNRQNSVVMPAPY